MVRFKKIRPRRGSLAVSIVWGSPIAASSRSAAFAYFMGSLRHDSRYSAIDMSVWLLASNDLAKALNKESLYMIPLHGKCRRTAATVELRKRFDLRYRLTQHGHSGRHWAPALPSSATQTTSSCCCINKQFAQ